MMENAVVRGLKCSVVLAAVLAALSSVFLAPAGAQDRDYREFRGDRERGGDRDGDRGERERGERYAEPQRSEWVLLGEQTVSFSADRDVINVGRDEGTFSRLRVDARNNDIYLYGLRVVFGNRTEQRIQVNQLIPAGGRPADFDLQGDRRGILTITLDYKARPNFRAARSSQSMAQHNRARAVLTTALAAIPAGPKQLAVLR
jgi:hypothetical protein